MTGLVPRGRRASFLPGAMLLAAAMASLVFSRRAHGAAEWASWLVVRPVEHMELRRLVEAMTPETRGEAVRLAADATGVAEVLTLGDSGGADVRRDVCVLEFLEGTTRSEEQRDPGVSFRRAVYLILHLEDNRWRRVGRYETEGARSRNFAPDAAVVSVDGGARWLVLTEGGGAGTGLVVEHERWIDLRDTPGAVALTRLQRYIEAATCRELYVTTDACFAAMVDGRPMIITQMTKRYEPDCDGREGADEGAFTRSGLAVYRVDEASGALVLDAARSTLSADEVAGLRDVRGE